MSATYTLDIFSSLDGYGSYRKSGDWGDYWPRCGVPGVQAFITRCVAFEIDVADSSGLNTELGPHGSAMRTGERVRQGRKIEHRCTARLHEFDWESRFIHLVAPSALVPSRDGI